MKNFLPIAHLVACVLFAPLAACAQSLQVLHTWNADSSSPNSAPIKATDGNFYGTTESSSLAGGMTGRGSIYRLTPEGMLTVIHHFTADGTPRAGLLQAADGFFYGTTTGGPNSDGTLFKLSADGAFTRLLTFQSTTVNNPRPALIQGTDGNLYGTANGGANGAGAVFRVTTAGQLTVLASLTTASGNTPAGQLLQHSDGSFYGTTYAGGVNSRGTIFRVTAAGALTVLYSFTAATGGNSLSGLARGGDGNFYGVSANTFYRITPAGVFTPLYTFTAATGYVPRGELVPGSDGFFYGALIRGGANDFGGVYRMSTAGAFTLLRGFTDPTYPGDFAGVVEGAPGLLYGATYGNRPIGDHGAAFKVTTAGALTKLSDFRVPGGQNPSGPLTEGAAGNLFSTTTFYNSSSGTVYRLAPDGTFTTLQDFGYFGTVGQAKGGVTRGSDGLLYGLSEGSTGNDGVAYRIAESGGSAAVLRTFSSGNGNPLGQLVQAADGNFYGKTHSGSTGAGTIFKLTPAGVLTTIFTFNGGAGGKFPNSPLILASDGRLYGTTETGGNLDRGTIFRITPGATPTFQTLVTFINTNGQTPTGALFAAPDNNLYGTTLYGGTGNNGTFFRLTTAGAHTVLASFGAVGTSRPRGAITRTGGGDFYGVTSEGGTAGVGSVYRLTSANVLTVLHSFTTTGPQVPMGGLTLGADAALYGTTTAGGETGLGSLFKMTTAGALTHLRVFDYSTGDTPFGEIFRANSGTLFGLNVNGGTAGGGTIYRITGAPIVTTQAASAVRATTATLNGLINPNGVATTAQFQYSTRADFLEALLTPAVPIGAGAVALPGAAAVSGLLPGTAYFARAVAQNSVGSINGATVNFITNTPPSGGTLTVTPASPVVPGTVLTATASGWTDPNVPLTYQFLLDDMVLGPPAIAATITFTGPASVGPHVVKVRVFDALVDFTETTRTLAVNNPPVARAVTLGASGGNLARIAVAKLLGFASDADGDTIALLAVSPASAMGGSVTLSAGIITYTPPPGYSGADSFTYTLRDSAGSTATGLVNVQVTAATAPTLNLVSMTRTADGFLLRFAGIPGAAYLVQFRDTMTDPAPWQTLPPPGPITAGTNGLFEMEDRPNPLPPSRFYRAVPAP